MEISQGWSLIGLADFFGIWKIHYFDFVFSFFSSVEKQVLAWGLSIISDPFLDITTLLSDLICEIEATLSSIDFRMYNSWELDLVLKLEFLQLMARLRVRNGLSKQRQIITEIIIVMVRFPKNDFSWKVKFVNIKSKN